MWRCGPFSKKFLNPEARIATFLRGSAKECLPPFLKHILKLTIIMKEYQKQALQDFAGLMIAGMLVLFFFYCILIAA